MSHVRVAVLRGGPSGEYDVSLKTGGEVLRHLPEKYRGVDVFISRDGEWHMHGVPRPAADIVRHVDVVFNALHGTYGEDGKVQRILEDLRVPYTGSRPLPSAMAMNKEMAKREVWKHGVKTPIYSTVFVGDDIVKRAAALFRTIPQPSVVKPVGSGSSLGVTIARSFEELLQGIYKALEISDTPSSRNISAVRKRLAA